MTRSLNWEDSLSSSDNWYKSAVLDRWAAVTFDAAVSGSIGVSFSMSGYGGGPVTVPASAMAARTLMSPAATGAGSPAA